MADGASPTNKAQSEIYIAFGRALSKWAYVEWQHSELFALIASGRAGTKSLEKAYWAIVSFDAKHKMVDAALTEALKKHHAFSQQWKALSNRLHQQSKKRNRLAHAQMVGFAEDGGSYDYALVTAAYSNPSLQPNEGMRLADVVHIEECFDKLGEDLLGFQRDYYIEQLMHKVPEIRYAYPEPPTAQL